MFYGEYCSLAILALISGICITLIFLILTTKKIYLKYPDLFCIMLFIILISATVSLNRYNLGLTTALGSRYTIYSSLLLVAIYISALLEYKLFTNYIRKSGIIIGISLYLLWLPNSLKILNNEYEILTTKLKITSNILDYDILKLAIKNKIFYPLKAIYNNLPMALPVDNQTLYHPGYDGHIDYITYYNGIIIIQGWGIIKNGYELPQTAIAKIDNDYYPINYGKLIRPDVVNYFNNPRLLNCGYDINIYASDFKKNKTNNNIINISIILVAKSGNKFYPGPPIKVDLNNLNHIKIIP